MKIFYCIALVGGVFFTAGCEKTREAFGLTRSQPDEFKVITRHTLYTPISTNLRAPAPGLASPFSRAPETQAKHVLGVANNQQERHSLLEKELLEKAKTFEKSSSIRQDLLQDTLEKHKSDADAWAKKLLYWQKKASEKGSPLDAQAEYKRLYGTVHPSKPLIKI